MSQDRIAMIRAALEAALQPEQLAITDQSQHHAGHASAGGAGHFSVRITAQAFHGKTPLQRHRMVYAAVADLMPTEIHALTIQARTPEEST